MHAPPARQSTAVLAAGLAAASLVSTLAAQPTQADPLDFYAVAPDLRAYVTAAAERNPALLESQARYQAARQRVPQVTALPDPVVSFTQALRSVETRVGPQLNSVTRRRDDPAGLPLPPDNGRNAVTVSLGVSLPLWSAKYRAGVEQANDELRAHTRRRAAARNAMEMEVQEAVIRLETLDRQIDLLDTVLIPQTEEALRSTETAYETGRLGVLELLDGERTLIDVRSMRARYLSDLLIALTALERAIGTPVPRTGRTP